MTVLQLAHLHVATRANARDALWFRSKCYGKADAAQFSCQQGRRGDIPPVDAVASSRYRPRHQFFQFSGSGEIELFNRYLMIAAAAGAFAAVPAIATVSPAPAQRTAAPAPSAQAPKSVTRAQFLANVQARFNALDTNHDGVLDANEVAAAQQKQLQQERAIEQQRLEAEFNRLDTNHDGQLSKAEFMAALPPVQPRETPQQIIGAIDSNKDGKVSLQEYQAGPLATFNKLDLNHDGVLTQQEIEAARSGAAQRKR